MNLALFITEVINALLNPGFCKREFLDVDDSFEPHTMFRRFFHGSNDAFQKMRFPSTSLDEVFVGFGCVFLLLLRETVWNEHRADNPLFPNIHEKN
jgi:hypothetical protein